jgi:hypothetical protein
MLEDAEKDIELLKGNDFEKSFNRLNRRLYNLMIFLDKKYIRLDTDYIRFEPSILKSTASLLQGRAINVAEVEKIKEKAESTSDLIKNWIRIARKIKKYWNWIVYLDEAAWNKEPVDKDIILKAYSKVIQANFELMGVEDFKSLEKMGIGLDLKEACSQLTYLMTKYENRKTSDKAKTAIQPEAMLSANVIETFMPNLLGLFVSLRSKSGEPLKMLEIEKAETWVGDLFVLLLSFSAAVLIGLNQLYFGKTFGTALDYSTALLIGFGSETILNGLKGTIAQINPPLGNGEESSGDKKK